MTKSNHELTFAIVLELAWCHYWVGNIRQARDRYRQAACVTESLSQTDAFALCFGRLVGLFSRVSPQMGHANGVGKPTRSNIQITTLMGKEPLSKRLMWLPFKTNVHRINTEAMVGST